MQYSILEYYVARPMLAFKHTYIYMRACQWHESCLQHLSAVITRNRDRLEGDNLDIAWEL